MESVLNPERRIAQRKLNTACTQARWRSCTEVLEVEFQTVGFYLGATILVVESLLGTEADVKIGNARELSSS
jgi:hypothetical protein